MLLKCYIQELHLKCFHIYILLSFLFKRHFHHANIAHLLINMCYVEKIGRILLREKNLPKHSKQQILIFHLCS